MPLRNLFYVSSLYEDVIRDKNIYSSRLVKVPAPHFIVFYNGIDEQPEQITLKLSDAFMLPEGIETGPELELKVRLININPGYNDDIVQNCRVLFEYQSYVQSVREYHRSMSLEDAVEHGVEECIKKGILRDFLLKNKAEVVHMSIFEYDYERHMKMLQQEAFEDGEVRGQEIGKEIGKEIGYKESILSLLGDKGEISNPVKERIMNEKDVQKIQCWLKVAARADTVEEFLQCLD